MTKSPDPRPAEGLTGTAEPNPVEGPSAQSQRKSHKTHRDDPTQRESTFVQTVPPLHEPHRPTRDGPTDEGLMVKFRDGDYAAFEVLYHRHRAPLFRFLVRRTANPSTAEEVFQDCWTNLIRSRARYTPSAKFTTFLYRIARNRLIDYARTERLQGGEHEPFVEDTHIDPHHDRPSDPEHQLSRLRRGQALEAALGQLPSEQSEVFLLHQEAGLTLDAIAEAVGVGRETVKSRLRYALNKLRDALEGVR
ncbi:MAG: RNA polymerase sigma factor [Pseudomonadota bacterium]